MNIPELSSQQEVNQNLINRISGLEQISGKLEPAEQERNEMIDNIRVFADLFISELKSAVVFSGDKVNEEVLHIDGFGRSITQLIEIYRTEVAEKGIKTASGGYMGYIPGGGLFVSAIADFIADVTNEYAGLHYASPGAATIEKELLNWMKSIFEFPADATGSLTSGGSVANLIALTAARDFHKVGPEKIRESVIYLSRQTHHSVQKALKIIGLGEVIIRYAETDDFFRINPSMLKEQIEKDKVNNLNPFLIIATAGTTDTGAVDPLEEIGEIAHSNNCWYHVDAAYGGFFILTSMKKNLFRGIDLADSLVTDPHKGLFLPSGSGAVLIKNRKVLEHSFQYTASYMQDSIQSDSSVFNPADVSPELTRHFRALRLWLPLQLHGIAPFVACLEEKLLLTEYLRNGLKEIGLMIGPEPDLSITYFWYPVDNGNSDSCNKRLLELILNDGGVFFSSTKINGRFVIRVVVLSFRTKLSTIDKALNTIQTALSKLKNEFNL